MSDGGVRQTAIPAGDGLLAGCVLVGVRSPHGSCAVGYRAFPLASHRPADCPLVVRAPSSAHGPLSAERTAQEFARAEAQVDVGLRDYQSRTTCYRQAGYCPAGWGLVGVHLFVTLSVVGWEPAV